jgi:hypothetical protein
MLFETRFKPKDHMLFETEGVEDITSTREGQILCSFICGMELINHIT